MKKSLTIFGIGGLIAAVLVPMALAAGPRRGERGDFEGRGERGQRLVELLGLNDAQAAELKALRQDMRDDVRDLRADIAEKREAIESALAAPTPDRARIAALTRAIGDLHARIADVHVDFAIAAKGILTPEQFVKFLAHRQEMKDRGFGGPGGARGGGHGRGGFHRGPGGFDGDPDIDGP